MNLAKIVCLYVYVLISASQTFNELSEKSLSKQPDSRSRMSMKIPGLDMLKIPSCQLTTYKFLSIKYPAVYS